MLNVRRDGKNFVYDIVDWRDHTAEAIITTVLFVGLTVGLHVLFNKAHKMRKKLCFYLRMKGALGPLIP